MRAFLSLMFGALLLGRASAEEAALLDRKDVPVGVAAAVACGTDADFVTRRPFGGGFLFAWRCASNNANENVALVFAETRDGSGAQLLRFPTPRQNKGRALEELSNVRWLGPADITQLHVDPETPSMCRTEGRWRLGGKRPTLIYWRQTRDCEGKRGWVTLVDRRRR